MKLDYATSYAYFGIALTDADTFKVPPPSHLIGRHKTKHKCKDTTLNSDELEELR